MAASNLNSLAHICEILQKREVAFLVISGAAVGFYGYTRLSTQSDGKKSEKPDFDFWYNPTYDNYYKLLKSINDLGVNVSRYMAEKTPNPHQSFFSFQLTECTIDIVPSLRFSIKFRDAYEAREVITLHEVDIPFIGLDDLLADKKIQPREKDHMDIEMLTKIKEGNNLDT